MGRLKPDVAVQSFAMHTSVRIFAAIVAVGAAVGAGIAQAPQGGQSDGALRARPGANREPEFPAPSIRDYKPRSTLVVPQHPVPRAKYPVIDIHSHQPAPITDADFKSLVASMDPLNLRILVNASGASGERLVRSIEASPYRDRMVMFSNITFQKVGPGFGQRAAQQLEADVKAGAVGLGEITKGFGLTARKADGTRLTLDDPELDPIWQTAARLNVAVLIHTADPQEFFQPLDLQNERWLEMSLFGDRRYPANRYPTFEQLMSERDRLFRKHPKTKFIAAHMGWHANDLGRLAKMFDAMPNVYGEVGAVLYDLGRQPRTAHEFMVKYQDRVLFGKDSYQPDEFPYFWRTFETADEYFDYYRDYHAFWKLYGLALPDVVLRKLYYGNALNLMPAVARTGFPQ
jgi:predicted TIM-barrel fold metal-dependent hydrolase